MGWSGKPSPFLQRREDRERYLRGCLGTTTQAEGRAGAKPAGGSAPAAPAVSREAEEQSPGADTAEREACGETGPGGLASAEAAQTEGRASTWSQTGATEGAEQARLDLPSALSGPVRLLGCSWSRNSDQV